MTGSTTARSTHECIRNYVLRGELAKGGMATIYIGHAIDSKVPVAIKRLSSHIATAELVTMFRDELELARRIQHPNIVRTIEVITTEDELCLVMDYVEGETLSKLMRACREQGVTMPVSIAAGIVVGALHGLHAAHEATDDRGKPLAIVHRDVSPQNIIVGVDGVARVLDFGVAKAAVRLAQTRTGDLKGKVAYMAPEQLERHAVVTRLTDIYATGILLWEALAGTRIWEADTEGQLVVQVMRGASDPPSKVRAEISKELDAVVMRALAFAPADRFSNARQFADAIERATSTARRSEIATWMRGVASKSLEARARRLATLMGVPEAPGSNPVPPAPASDPSTRGSSRASIPSLRGSTPSVLRTPSRFSEQTLVGTGIDRKTPAHILVIDDSQVILDKARQALEAEGYRVTTTTQTVGAARHLVDCDLALIDFHMPGFNGAAVIQSLRAASKSSSRTCLFYLYTSDPEVARDYARAGFDGVLTGKGDEAALVRGVRAALRVLKMRAMKK